MKKTLTTKEVYAFARRSNIQAAVYLLRLYGYENFEGGKDEYLKIMQQLSKKVCKK